MRKGFWKTPSAIAIVLTIIVAGYAASKGFIEVSLRGLESAEIGTAFLTLIFVALVIERAVEVFISNRYDPEEMKIQRGIREAQQRLTLWEEALGREIAREVPRATDTAAAAANSEERQATIARLRAQVDRALEGVRAEKVAVLTDQIDLETRKSATAGAVATILGVVAATAGVRILGQFLPVDPDTKEIAGPLAQTCADIAGEIAALIDETAKVALTNSCEAVEFQLTAFRFADVLLTALLLAGGADGIHQLVKDFLSKKNDLRPTG